MAKLLALVLGLGITMFTAYYYIKGQVGPTRPDGKSAPKQTLDNVRGAAKQIEEDAQKRVDDAVSKGIPQQ